ncbi:DUF3502 domain-containing protein [Paenibacillus sp. P26]|nr:DUF3502 domain-containing protein [Paenibacillus sp. P26]
MDDKEKAYFDYSAKTDSYSYQPLGGFQFDNSAVKSEYANISSKTDPFIQMLKAGQIKDWETQFEKLNGDLKQLGLEKIRAELKKQIQEYLDKGGK